MSDSPHPPEDHGWVRSRLVALASGMLDDEVAARVRRHLDQCSDCRARFEESKSADTGEERASGHIPSGLFATWERSSLELKGLERRMVARHLETCEACRADLALLGHAPRLAESTAPETRLNSSLREVGTTTQTSPRGKVLRPRQWSSWQRWVYAGGALATAAALMILLRTIDLPDLSPKPPANPGGPAPAGPSGTPAGPPVAPGTHGSSGTNPSTSKAPVPVDAVPLYGTRGTTLSLPEIPIVLVPRDADKLAIHELWIFTEAPRESVVVIAMFGPNGEQLARRTTTVGRIVSDGSVVFPVPTIPPAAAPQDFAIVVTVPVRGPSPPDTARFVIRLAPAPR